LALQWLPSLVAATQEFGYREFLFTATQDVNCRVTAVRPFVEFVCGINRSRGRLADIPFYAPTVDSESSFSPNTSCVRNGFSWWSTPSFNNPFWMLGLPPAEIVDDLVQVVMMLFDVLVADSPNFLDDLIAVHSFSFL
jgi:hypothetical protein